MTIPGISGDPDARDWERPLCTALGKLAKESSPPQADEGGMFSLDKPPLLAVRRSGSVPLRVWFK